MTHFTNAQEMHRLHPDTFDAPSETELAAIRPGHSVKVCTGGERFWVTVTQALQTELAGTVDNVLVCSEEHGLRLGDTITFPRECVYAVLLPAVREIPPDPEGCNDRRSERANAAIEAYVTATGTDRGNALSDLLADLMHWADRNEFEFDACLEHARRHYETETAGEVAA